jgi:glyoxylase I family protein
MAVKIEHFGIYAKDSEALSNWYRDILGFTVVRKLEKYGRPPIYFLESSEGGQIEILPTTKERRKRELEEPGFSHIGIVIDNFEKYASYLESKGITLHGVRVTSQGWKIGYFRDPEGNTLQIVEQKNEENKGDD